MTHCATPPVYLFPIPATEKHSIKAYMGLTSNTQLISCTHIPPETLDHQNGLGLGLFGLSELVLKPCVNAMLCIHFKRMYVYSVLPWV